MTTQITLAEDDTNAAGFPPAPPETLQRADGAPGDNWAKAYRGMSATYSPEDNKLRLSSASRLPADLYKRVRDAGFIWAPRQEIFVAPMWTPGREDLLIELCGEIGDEDTSLVERAEERAERFENYSDKRAADSSAAHAAVTSIAKRFEFGQPILIGHHSERGARKDQERMDNGMRKAVKMWDTSKYWEDRAAGALAHAKYKELPAVRARRIKGIQSDLRRQERSIADAESGMALWKLSGLTPEIAERIASAQRVTILKEGTSDYVSLYSLLTARQMSVEDAAARSIKAFERSIARANRWANHYKNRIAYETAMLEEGGGLKADGFDIKPGGHVLVRGEWLVVVKVNKVGDRINSVSTNSRFVRVKPIEAIKDYRDPTAEALAAVTKATTLPPLCNYPGEGFHSMTKAEWEATHKDYKGSRQLGQGSQRMSGTGRPDIKVEEGAAVVGLHRVRSVVQRGRLVAVFLSDVKRKDAPAATEEPAAPVGNTASVVIDGE